MANYLVTGCAGFIGSHLAESLIEREHEVIGIDSFTDYYPRKRKEGNLCRLSASSRFRLVEGDLVELDLPAFVAGVDGVFHLAGQPGVRGSFGRSFPTYVHNNLIATQRVFEAAAAAGVRVMFASSSSVYGDAEHFPVDEASPLVPRSPYGVTKLGCEQLARVYSESFRLDTITMRYFTVYGPRQRPDMAFARILSALVAGRPFDLNGTGEQSRDFTYIGDAVEASIHVMDHAASGSVYNVGGGTEATLLEVIELCEQLTGRELDVRRVAGAAGDVQRTCADTMHLRSDLGWSPQTDLPTGVAAQLEAILDEDAAPAKTKRAGAARR